jgi:tyrosyl-tRNA synthetase
MEKINLDNKRIDELLSRGVEEIIDRSHLEKKLKSGKQLRVKLGIDPTSPNIHLGRSIPLLKLRDFQEMGHKIILIIGDFTGVIGDTSDKDSERPMLQRESVEKNLKTYIKQASKIINTNTAEVYHNSEWLEKLNYIDIGRQADAFSLNEFISRENIDRRLSEGKRISLRELLYPLMQGYDSVKVNADVEIGGTDQRFNLLAGRDMQRLYGQEPQDILTNPLIEGLDGRKMSSSFGNTVNLFDTPEDIFGKIMSLKDDFIIKYFTLLARVDMSIIREHEKSLHNGINPRDIKIKLALEIVKMYYDFDSAKAAQLNWERIFSKKEIPEIMPEIKVIKDSLLLDILVEHRFIESKTQARRLFGKGAIKDLDNDNKITDFQAKVMTPINLKIGKKIFVKISLSSS